MRHCENRECGYNGKKQPFGCGKVGMIVAECEDYPKTDEAVGQTVPCTEGLCALIRRWENTIEIYKNKPNKPGEHTQKVMEEVVGLIEDLIEQARTLLKEST